MSLMALARRGLQAFHSSPHKFDKFEWSPRTRGTGEGAAAFGEGLYLAENPAVSGRGGQYWNQFQHRFSEPEKIAAQYLQLGDFDRDKAIKAAQEAIAKDAAWRAAPPLPGSPPSRRFEMEQKYVEREKEVLRLLESGEHVGPYTYEVGIRAKPEQLLDWDKPISQQPEAVRDLGQRTPWGFEPKTGEDVYRALQYEKAGAPRTPELASQRLREAGIPGHRFLDQGSRGLDNEIAILKQDIERTTDPELRGRLERELVLLQQDPKTHNYVIYEPGILDIMKRYAVPGAAPLAGLGALNQQGRPESPPPLDTLGRMY